MHIDENYIANNNRKPEKKSSPFKGILVAVLISLGLMLLITLGFVAISLAVFPKYDPNAIAPVETDTNTTTQQPAEETSNLPTTETEQVIQPAAAEQAPVPATPTKLIAKYQDVDIYSPITTNDLTGVLFHQASYEYGLVMQTELPLADEEKALAENATRINKDQREGEWLDAEALHLYRAQDSTPMDTSIDVGADPESLVYAPVSGTVILVKDYQLYAYIPDIEIHIRPDGRDDLDMVVIHTQNPLVKAGDRVVGGESAISYVRNISADLDGIQLDDYDGDQHFGNHAHIQINDANWPEYRQTKLEGATN